MFSAPPKDASTSDSEGIDPRSSRPISCQRGALHGGSGHLLSPVASDAASRPWQRLAEGFTIGMRFHSAPVIRLADAKPVQLGHVVKADGRFRLFAFADSEDPAAPSSRLGALCDFLARSPHSPVRKHTPVDADIDSAIDVRAIFQQAHRDLKLDSVPAFLLPKKGRYGLTDYEKCSART